MPKVSINILTKNRVELLKKAIESVLEQSFKDYELVVVNDGSTDNTEVVLKDFQVLDINLKIINHKSSLGITQSRQEALEKSSGEYIAILDDDDEWIDVEKLKKQVEYLDQNSDCVLVGGGIEIVKSEKSKVKRLRPSTDLEIRKTMLFRNNFFTSTVLFRKSTAIKAGGFVRDEYDFGEDYDLWLRMGTLGQLYNFQESFVKYRLPSYNKEKFSSFLKKQLKLVKVYKKDYPGFILASLLLKLRLIFSL